MYEYIKGNLAAIRTGYAVVEAGGIGYKVNVTGRFAMETGKECTLFIYQVVREGEFSLYGFEDEGEREMFSRIVTVNGVGPKVGMAVLSVLTPGDVSRAIAGGDTSAFTRVSGVGKKTAERIVFDLKGKVSAQDMVADLGQTTSSPVADMAVEALVSLGYDKKDALSAVSAVSMLAVTVEDITLLALKRISG